MKKTISYIIPADHMWAICFLYKAILSKKNSCHFCHLKQTYNSLTYNIFIRIVKSDSKVKSNYYSNMVIFVQ